jgi:hypothetical protein
MAEPVSTTKITIRVPSEALRFFRGELSDSNPPNQFGHTLQWKQALSEAATRRMAAEIVDGDGFTVQPDGSIVEVAE